MNPEDSKDCEKMKFVSSNVGLYQQLASRLFAASSVASRIHPSLLGPKTANTAQLLAGGPPRTNSGPSACAIHTTPSFSAEKVLEEVKSNPYFEKYKSKIKKGAALNAQDDHALARKVVEARQKLAEEEPEEVKMIRDKLNLLEETSDSPVKLSKKDRPGLNDIVKLELFHEKTADEIQHIWLEYHKGSAANVVSAVVPPKALLAMTSQSAVNPQFLYAVPRGQGMEFVLGQWKKTDCYFTPLIQYQTHGENAPVALTIHHFDELVDSKEVVLMRGEFDPNVFSAVEAQFLSMQMQLYYGEKTKPSKRRLLHLFNHEPKHFHYMDVVAELDTI